MSSLRLLTCHYSEGSLGLIRKITGPTLTSPLTSWYYHSVSQELARWRAWLPYRNTRTAVYSVKSCICMCTCGQLYCTVLLCSLSWLITLW